MSQAWSDRRYAFEALAALDKVRDQLRVVAAQQPENTEIINIYVGVEQALKRLMKPQP